MSLRVRYTVICEFKAKKLTVFKYIFELPRQPSILESKLSNVQLTGDLAVIIALQESGPFFDFPEPIAV
jgi:hypothetical protein